MSQVIARRTTTAGAILVKRICGSCKHGFWSGHNDHRFECVDCDPNVLQHESHSIGRNMDRKRSDNAYHGAGYNG